MSLYIYICLEKKKNNLNNVFLLWKKIDSFKINLKILKNNITSTKYRLIH
jgi:hypothetical protein